MSQSSVTPPGQAWSAPAASLSPIRLLADLPVGTLKPPVSMSCLSLRASELYMLLNRCHALAHGTHNVNFSASNVHLQQLIGATEPLRSRYQAKQWRKYKNKAFVLQQCVDFKDRLNNSEFQEIPGARDLTSLLVSKSYSVLLTIYSHIQCVYLLLFIMQWLLNAARSTLRHLYETSPDSDSESDGANMHRAPSYPSVLRDLTSLHEKLSTKRDMVGKILNDLAFLKQLEELYMVYEAEIKLVTDMALQHLAKAATCHNKHSLSAPLPLTDDGPDSNPMSTGMTRTVEECVVSLASACQQQLEVEKNLQLVLEKTEERSGEPQSSSVQSSAGPLDVGGAPLPPHADKLIRSSASNNPLLLVLRNVF
jgi:hypothetical protein